MSIRENLSVVASDLVAMLRTRIALFSAEFVEQKHRLITIAAMLFAAGLFLLLAVVVASFLVVAFFWPTEHRYLAIGLLSFVYALAGFGLIWVVRHRLKTESAPFSVTLEELHRDLVVLGQLRESFLEGLRESEAKTDTPTDNTMRGGHHE